MRTLGISESISFKTSRSCNKNLLLALLRIDPGKTFSPSYPFIRRLIKNLWPETLSEPINPGGLVKYFRKVVKRNSVLRYYNLRTKTITLFTSA